MCCRDGERGACHSVAARWERLRLGLPAIEALVRKRGSVVFWSTPGHVLAWLQRAFLVTPRTVPLLALDTTPYVCAADMDDGC